MNHGKEDKNELLEKAFRSYLRPRWEGHVMITIQGKGVSRGIVSGKLRFYLSDSIKVESRIVADVKKETDRFTSACAEAVSQLATLQAETKETLGEENSSLFELHQMLIEDDDYQQSVKTKIENQSVCAEYAVWKTSQEYIEMFSNLKDEYMSGRAADIKDISDRLVRILTGVKENQNQEKSEEQYILAADDFTPSETAQLDRSKVIAIVTSGGTATSHTAIFARTMGIPAVSGVGEVLKQDWEGRTLIVNGTDGVIYVDPNPEIFSQLQNALEAEKQRRSFLEAFRGKPSETKDGRRVNLFANIGSLADADLALQNDAEGIGLFRSEFLFLESKTPPTEDEQFTAYKTVAEKFGTKQVIIRTLDIGADKQVPYLNLQAESNPALGMRAIRLCLSQPDLFRTQLRAIYRASVYGNLAIMFPMINSIEDVRRAKLAAEKVRDELKQESVSFNPAVPIGIMIETPAAAIISDLLAKEVDFFSIGTNDLTQYTLAVDRQNSSLNVFCDIHHEALMRLIRFTAKSAHENGISVGICGELGSDEALVEMFLSMKIDELSVSPGKILGLRSRIAQIGHTPISLKG